jgi:hypothetical protein
MRESSILHRCLLALSEAGHLAWRNNTGVGWAGQTIRFSKPTIVTIQPGDVLIKSARPLRAGLCVGGADIIGIGPEGRFYGIETKTAKGKQSIEQSAFGHAVKKHGGLYGVARCEDDAIEIIGR